MDKKSIIITFQNAVNYGAVLQCYALQNTLEKNNINVEVLNYDNKIIGDCYKIFYYPKNEKSFKMYLKSFISAMFFFNQLCGRNAKFRKFIKHNIHLTEKYSKKNIKDKDFGENTTLIAGSDQIWNTDLTNGFDDVYYLNFSDNSKKISYAASIGKNELDSKFLNDIKKCLNKFDYISVREETGKLEIDKKLNKNVDVVLDPTLLIDKEEWEKKLEHKKIDCKYIFVYMPNVDVIKSAKYISEKENLKIVNISKKHYFGRREINKFRSDPIEFLTLLYNAEYIITTSFHATSFSIIFNKKIIVFPPEGLSSRITNLTEKLKLNDIIYNSFSEIKTARYKNSINYTNANKLLLKYREESIKKLLNNI